MNHLARTAAAASIAALSLFLSCGRQDSFSIEGHISGLQTGDTLRFSAIEIPGWGETHAFDIVVGDTSGFSYTGRLAHDQYFSYEYLPCHGSPEPSDRTGKTFIARPGDRLGLEGTRRDIYYATLSGGIYDEPMLAELLRVGDSLGIIRAGYARNIELAGQQGDTEAMREWAGKFNSFYYDNPGIERQARLESGYAAANPQGTLYLLVDRLPSISYEPLDSVKAVFEAYSDEIRQSWYGRKTAAYIEKIESLVPGMPAPEFTLVTTSGDTLTKPDFAGKYLLFYHWGLCPGSLYIDRQVIGLHDRYSGRGLEVIGLTESVASIREVYEATQAGGDAAMSATLKGMLEHAWPEVELETDRPENAAINDSYEVSGWPFFILIGPDGRLLARGFTDAFYDAEEILSACLGHVLA